MGNICVEIHNSSNSFSALIANNNDTIPAIILYVNTAGFCVTKLATNQAAKRFEQTEENTLSCGRVNSKENLTNFHASTSLVIFQIKIDVPI